MMHRDRKVEPAAIAHVAMLTVEGEHDDISGVGQTKAAHDLVVNLPADRRAHHLQLGVGHYGVFNGTRFRAEIAPRIADFIATHDGAGRANRANGHASANASSAGTAQKAGIGPSAGPSAKPAGPRKPRKRKVSRSQT